MSIDHDQIQQWLDEATHNRAPLFVRDAVQQVVYRALREADPEDYQRAFDDAAMACEAVTVEAEAERDAVIRELQQANEVIRMLRLEKQRLLQTIVELRDTQEPPSIRRALAYKMFGNG